MSQHGYVGKHRAPARRRHAARSRTVPRFVVGSTGLAVASTIVMAAANSAHADTGSGVNWDAIASCESGNNWQINTGNGFYGGLQFALSTWRSFGGTGMPQNASRETQIAVAERVLAGQGIGAWPVCGRLAHAASPAAPKPAPVINVAASAPAPTYSGPTTEVVVQAGDTLSAIAAVHNVTGGWSALYSMNRGALTNPDMIYPGQRIAVPAP